jgi:ketosteroid isomerase-like protein
MGNVQVVRDFYAAVGSGNLPAGLALLTPDCGWTEMEGLADAGTFHGPDEVRDSIFVRIGGEWDGFGLAVDEVLDAGGDTVVGVGTYSGTFKATGRPMEARVVHVFRVREGKIAAFEQFADTLRIVAAKEA